MVYMLFDNPADKDSMRFLENNNVTSTFEQIYPPEKCDSVKKMISTCWKCLKQTKKNDTIVCWYDFMAVVCWWMCKFVFRNRKIVALNILLKDKTTIKNKVAKILYKFMLKSSNVQATVTSQQYGEWLNETLGIKRKYVLLHDVYHKEYDIGYNEKVMPNTVFCGGRNGRDWGFLIEIARMMPELTFNCVMPEDKFNQYKDLFCDNMRIKTDISKSEFLELMTQSQFLVVPLDTMAPSGLIVFYQAAANGKMVITSDTVTTQEYFSCGRGITCGMDKRDWIRQIDYFVKKPDEMHKYAMKFKEYLMNECSEEKYTMILGDMIAD